MKVPTPKKLPSGRWFVQVRVGGVSRSITCDTEKECLRQAQLYKAEVLAGKREAGKQKTAPTLRDAFTAYIQARDKVFSPASIVAYQNVQRNCFQTIMDTPIDQIKNFQAAINRDAAALSPVTVRCAWGKVVAVLSDNGIHTPKVKLPQIPPKEHAYLQPDQIPAFIEALHGRPVEIASLLGLHSLRAAEITGLRWEDVDLEKKTLHVNGTVVKTPDGQYVERRETKTAKSNRTIPILIPELMAALEAVPPEKRVGRVVNRRPDKLSGSINRVCDKAGLPHIGAHGLRHSFASLCYHLGLSEKTTMKLGGWSNFKVMRDIYTHLAEKDEADGVEELRRFLGW